MAPKKKKQQQKKKKNALRTMKVNHLQERLRRRGETRAVDERLLSSTRVLSRLKSVSELDSLFAKKPRSLVWMSESVYLYKRNYLRYDSCNLLSTLPEMKGVQFRVLASDAAGQPHKFKFEVHWVDDESDSTEVMFPLGSFFRLLARDGTVKEIDWFKVDCWPDTLRSQPQVLPLTPQALSDFFGKAASPRMISFVGTAFTKEQCPALFTSKDGAVAIKELDVASNMLDPKGSLLLRALKEGVGVAELNLVKAQHMNMTSFARAMGCLRTNRLVHTLSVRESALTDEHVKKLCALLRRTVYLKHFAIVNCILTDAQWKALWGSIEVNTSIRTVEIRQLFYYTSRRNKAIRDGVVVDVLTKNTTLEHIHYDPWHHGAQFANTIARYLAKNRYRARALAIAAHPCQKARWAILGSALCHPKVRCDPGSMFTFLKTNLDSVVSNAPKGKEILISQLKKLNDQRAVVLDKIREYEEAEKRASRKRPIVGILETWFRKKARA